MTPGMRWIAPRLGGPEVLELEQVDLPAPGAGEVLVHVRASGMNPADVKHIAAGQPDARLPLLIGFEVAGTVEAIGRDVAARDGIRVGDEVIASPIEGGYASAVLVAASDVFRRPPELAPVEAANLLLVGTTAAELLARARVARDDVVLLHGASGSVGVSVLQQAALIGATVIGTSGAAGFDTVRQFGGTPVAYGPGLLARVRAIAPGGVTVALDTAGTDEAIDVSVALVQNRDRIVTIAAFARGAALGLPVLGSGNPASPPFRAQARARIVDLAARGAIRVPVARAFPFAAAQEALALVASGHPRGKVALVMGTDRAPEDDREERP